MIRLAPLFLLLAACGNSDPQLGPDAMSIDEAKALDDAAAMLTERRPPRDTATEADAP